MAFEKKLADFSKTTFFGAKGPGNAQIPFRFDWPFLLRGLYNQLLDKRAYDMKSNLTFVVLPM